MFEAKLTIAAPELALAINRLADAWAYRAPETLAAPAVPTAASASAAPVPTVPVTPPVVPVAPAPGFTLDQVGKAGADLLAANPSKMAELMTLLGQFGVRSVSELKQEQLGAFATALRGLGAKL